MLDNSFPAATFYLDEQRLCSLHLGSLGSPFLRDIPLLGVILDFPCVILSEVTAWD
jgi:hypothetical protein